MQKQSDSYLFESFEVIVLCLVWYGKSISITFFQKIFISFKIGVSAAGNVIVKELLNEFPFPLTVTLVQLVSVWLFSVPLL